MMGQVVDAQRIGENTVDEVVQIVTLGAALTRVSATVTVLGILPLAPRRGHLPSQFVDDRKRRGGRRRLNHHDSVVCHHDLDTITERGKEQRQ